MGLVNNIVNWVDGGVGSKFSHLSDWVTLVRLLPMSRDMKIFISKTQQKFSPLLIF